ncbi:class I SAM-dependent methyltransferase [Flavobacterium sp. ov086]|uniref:class I SAM-dependent methyltransferase n=1 Tax=Flavobacterium sp. ov086 TaxID=1761785 RepID=UPI000B6FA5A3|nr:methyltransferase domain-containing protein [Flavobacterium sp. ov086]SNR93886.1 Methyltransferase domain-containing protein [Flavobacterium sp. ov086]
MIFKSLKQNIDIEDDKFNELYPVRIKRLSKRHWTPVVIAKIAADYLVDKPNQKILDIGAGVGKFCLVGAATTKGIFYGVEQRASLTKLSKKIAEKHNINNVEFIHSNITEISFSDYDAFYFYNSFFENIDTSCPIDKKILPKNELFLTYSNYVRDQLNKTPKNTRLVTYWSTWEEIPESFDLKYTACDGLLNFWKKR